MLGIGYHIGGGIHVVVPIEGSGGSMSPKQALAFMMTWLVTAIIMIITVICIVTAPSKHDLKSYECPMCHSHDTKGFFTCFTNDGLCVDENDSRAAYTYITCKDCDYTFKLYKKDWKD